MNEVEISDSRLFYKRCGAGSPSLLFVHGGFCDHSDWEFQLRDLDDEFTVVALDQRCHGKSEADPQSVSVPRFAADLQELIEALELGDTILIGHSLGARVVIEAAAQGGDRLAGAVLVDGSRLNASASSDAANKLEQERFGRDPAAYLAYRFKEMFFEDADPALRDRVVQTAVSTPPHIIRAVASATGQWDALGLIAALERYPQTLPTLAIQSTFHDDKTERYTLRETDRTTPWLDRLKRHIPDLEVEIVPHVGHFTMLEAPEPVNAAIRNFARALRAQGR